MKSSKLALLLLAVMIIGGIITPSLSAALLNSITVTFPNGGENWTRGTTQTIRWNSSGSPGAYVKIELLKAGIFNRTIIASTPNDGTHPWPIRATLAPGTDYKVKITSTAKALYNDTSDNNFTIPVPSIKVVFPNGSENLTRGTIQTIRWNSTENPKSYVKIELLKAGIPVKTINASTLNDGTHSWLIPAAQTPGNTYNIRVSSTSNLSNNDTSDNSFTIPVPSIKVVSPNGLENWTRGTTQTIRWNSTENPKSYVKIELLKAGIFHKTIIASTLNDGSHSWLIPGTQALGTDYQVRITSTANISVKDTSDNKFTISVPTSSFRFIAWADTKSGTSILKSESIIVNSLNPVFTIYPGDLISCTSSTNPSCFSNGFSTWKTALNGGGTNNLFDRTFATRGNHDANTNTPWQANFEFATIASKVGASNYRAQTQDLTYSFDYGNSHFVGIDMTAGGVTSMPSTAMTWLDNDLTAAEGRNLTHAFLFWHGPIYTVDGHCCEVASSTLVNILNKHPIVSAAFFGHEHVVAYTHIDSSRIPGVTHEFEEFISGDAGAGPNTIVSGRADGWLNSNGIWSNSGTLNTAHGFMSVDVSGSSYTVSVYNMGGSVAKTFSFSN